ncbi:hypothetical protein [uncultured Bacteroides sp.]|uniref:hypothetical protein n=1 Tax=uncultured Bacteroides sp. TaxID=162156 RepID=UPI002AAB2DBC|nr:hypothetical protein [uncultured Bacteroides sp.]
MALTTDEEVKVRQIITAFTNGKKVSDLSSVTSILGGETMEIIQNGVSKKVTIDQLRIAATPDANGCYPDVPLNRVSIQRYSGQESTVPTMEGNLSIIDKIKATAYPCLIDRSSKVVAKLNGNTMRKTADGTVAVLNDWTMPAMLAIGGIWFKYEYNAATNVKTYKFSTLKVLGYKYIRRRFLNLFGGSIYNDGTKNYLTSRSGVFTTQNTSLVNYQAYALNMGSNFRAIAAQDQEVYRFYFWLIEQNFNSQAIIRGICDVNSTNWSLYSRTGDTDGAGIAGQSSYAQMYKTGEFTLDIVGHKGSGTNTVTMNSVATTVAPYKWLWREGMLAGPYWLYMTGYLILGNKVYKAKDLKNIHLSDVTTANIATYYDYYCDIAADSGFILENFEGSLIPSLVGGTDSKGMADYLYRPTYNETTLYIPAGLGAAYNGSNGGLSLLHSDYGVSTTNPSCGGALASDDPADTISDGTIAA